MVNIGIDIGTSNTVVAKVNADGKAEVYTFDGAYLVPSAIYVDQIAGRRSVGADAQREWADLDNDPASSFRRWKLLIGDEVELRTIQHGVGVSTLVTPERLTTWLVEHVVGAVADGTGGETVDSVLVTVPHGWRREDSSKCVATREAARQAVVRGNPLTVSEVTVSEPVAAAAFWLHNVENRADFLHRTVLVVDIGGGTFDLSLIEVGEENRPLAVVDAINSNFAGDYVTALVMGEAIRALNSATGSTHPTEPEELLDQLARGVDGWLRQIFLDAQEVAWRQSRAIESAESRGNPPSSIASRPTVVVGPDGELAQFSISAARMVELMEPFYDEGRTLLRHFLHLQARHHLPYAVMFAGGGSKLGGIEANIVRPVLDPLVADVGEVLTRIRMNTSRVDQAIALGAALIADGRESIEERLLYDVGLSFNAPGSLARHLGLGDDDRQCIVSPFLSRGSVLPALFSTKARSFPEISAPSAGSLELDIVVFDDPEDPWVRTWEDSHPGHGKAIAVDLEVWANADGVLGVDVTPRSGGTVRMEGQLQRNRRLREAATLTFTNGVQERAGLPVVSPEQLERATRLWRQGL